MKTALHFLKATALISLICSGTSFAQFTRLTASPSYTSCILNSGNTLFVGTSGSGIFVSADAGINYTNPLTFSSACDIRRIAMVGNTLYAGTSNEGVYKSSNMGQTWSLDSAGMHYWQFGFQDHDMMESIGDKVFVNKNQYGLYYKTNTSPSWIASKYPVGTNQKPTGIVINGTILFCSAQFDGVYTSTDGGINWTQAANANFPTGSLGYEQINDLAILNGKLYAGGYRGLFVSSDNAASWTQLVKDSVIIELHTANNVMFISTDKGGVYKTTDGTNFTSIKAGLERSVYSYTAIGNDLYVSQGKAGVYKYGGFFTGTSGLAGITKSGVKLYPNPATDKLNIELTNAGQQMIRLIDLQGKTQVEKVISGLRESIDISILPRGIYILQHITNLGTTSTKINLQ